MFRDNLPSQDTYMLSVNSDIKKFNNYVKLNSKELKVHGEQCHNIMAKLFNGYRAASDK